jgi:hypothetical protein
MKNKEALILRVIVGLLLLWLLISFLKSNGTQKTDVSSSKLEQENLQLQHNIDALQVGKSKLLDDITFVNNRIAILKDSIIHIQKSTSIKLAKIKTFDSGEIALFLQERYERFNEVKTTANGTEITDTIGIKVITDLVTGDDAINELRFTKEILKRTENNVLKKDSLWNLTENQLSFSKQMYSNCLTDNSKLKEENNKEIKFRLLAGLEYGNNTSLSNSIFKANLSGQNSKGNIYRFSIDNNKNYYIGYDFSIFSIKGIKK